MRWWWLIALAGCPNKPVKQKPHDAAIVIARDAAMPPDAMGMMPQAGEVAVPGPAPFYIDKLETTIAEYRACVDANLCAKSGIEFYGKHPEHAMGGVTFMQARAYCAWKGKRLPTPDEWKRAAYGDDARKFPWGDEPPTCERAVINECKAEGPLAPGGREAGASAFGALDMLGNATEWTDAGPLDFTSACITMSTRRETPLLGGGFYDNADSPSFARENVLAKQPTWFDNREQGIRCARDARPVAAPPATKDPVLTATTWTIASHPRASDAIEEVARRCKAGEQATWIAGELVGQKGWAVVTVTSAGTVKPPAGLVRVVGVASCGTVDDNTKLTVKTDAKTWRLDIPSRIGIYQMWLPPGTWATFEIACTAPPSRGDCSFSMTRAAPARFRVPIGPASGVEGPSFEADGGMTCD